MILMPKANQTFLKYFMIIRLKLYLALDRECFCAKCVQFPIPWKGMEIK